MPYRFQRHSEGPLYELLWRGANPEDVPAEQLCSEIRIPEKYSKGYGKYSLNAGLKQQGRCVIAADRGRVVQVTDKRDKPGSSTDQEYQPPPPKTVLNPAKEGNFVPRGRYANLSNYR